MQPRQPALLSTGPGAEANIAFNARNAKLHMNVMEPATDKPWKNTQLHYGSKLKRIMLKVAQEMKSCGSTFKCFLAMHLLYQLSRNLRSNAAFNDSSTNQLSNSNNNVY